MCTLTLPLPHANAGFDHGSTRTNPKRRLARGKPHRMLLNALYTPPYQPRIGRTQPAQRESGEDRAWNRRSVKPPTKNGDVGPQHRQDILTRTQHSSGRVLPSTEVRHDLSFRGLRECVGAKHFPRRRALVPHWRPRRDHVLPKGTGGNGHDAPDPPVPNQETGKVAVCEIRPMIMNVHFL